MEQEKLYVRPEMRITRFDETIITASAYTADDFCTGSRANLPACKEIIGEIIDKGGPFANEAAMWDWINAHQNETCAINAKHGGTLCN